MPTIATERPSEKLHLLVKFTYHFIFNKKLPAEKSGSYI